MRHCTDDTSSAIKCHYLKIIIKVKHWSLALVALKSRSDKNACITQRKTSVVWQPNFPSSFYLKIRKINIFSLSATVFTQNNYKHVDFKGK